MQANLLARVVDKLNPWKPLLVALSFSPWLIIIYLIVSTFVSRLIPADREILKSFIEWFGTAYSLFLALVLVNVWSKYETLEREFDAEVDAVATLHQTINYIKEAATPTEPTDPPLNPDVTRWIGCIEKNIEKYADHVIRNYREEDKFAQQRRNGDLILTEIGHFISSLAHKQLIGESFIRELFTDLNAIRDVRSDRISHSKQRTPETVWWVAIIASIVWLLPYLGLVIDNGWARSFLIIGVAFVITIVLVIIKDLDEPYEGTWKIELDEWDLFFDLFQPTPHLLFIFSNKDRFVDSMSRTWIGGWLSLSKCKFSSLIHEDLFQRKWKSFLDQISKPRTQIRTPRYDILYSASFTKNGYDIPLPAHPMPSVVLRRGDQFDIVMRKQDIEVCTNFAAFKTSFDQNINQFIPGF